MSFKPKPKIKTREEKIQFLNDIRSGYVQNNLTFCYQSENKYLTCIRGKPNHPQTQGKIERYHRSMKNVIKLDNYYSPDELRTRLAESINYYNNYRYHKSLNNLTLADVFFNRERKILEKRKKIKLETIKNRRNQYLNEKLNLLA